MNFHPATLLLGWGSLVVALQSLPVTGLAWANALLLPLTIALARRRTFSLMRRARWLLLSILALFVIGTPGERLPGIAGDIGITFDGLSLAAEHGLRLVLLLATLALLHERLGTAGMMTGLHRLLAPLAGWRTLRERIIVRLMLVLEDVETAPPGNWRAWMAVDGPGPERLTLAVSPLRAPDWMVLASLFAAVLIGLNMA